ncbi:hypothetical protein BV898_00977 [Hypsibius exemplaris]|uniref:Mitochondrial cardiolipin hydrolase n=1 Tax=Hypsibius exemplaris TaxID=2072580 RepID=A0A1W0XCT4_HYPEX|nr:hypothetical protein BV898_00977 [Hypsibius exemplaris]
MARVRDIGVAVRMNREAVTGTATLHHKFVIIDGRHLFMGSVSFTLLAVLQNREDIIESDILELVKPYQEQFNRLWELFGAEPQLDLTTSVEHSGCCCLALAPLTLLFQTHPCETLCYD